MFVLGIDYLNEWSMAAPMGMQKDRPEWPPHPDRIFMAMAAAWFETGEDSAEGAALRWIESLSPPAIAASDAVSRTVVTSYVPVNDTRVKKTSTASTDLEKLKSNGLGMLPEHRLRQPRSFPVAIPHDPKVYLIWPEAEMGVHRAALERLVAKVTHVGHSASFVRVWVVDRCEVAPTWQPVEGLARHRLRVPVPGRLDQLARDYNGHEVLEYAALRTEADRLRGKAKRRLNQEIRQRFGDLVPVSRRPRTGRWLGYDQPKPPVAMPEPGTVFDPHLIVFAIRGRQISLPTTLKLTQALRNVLMDTCPLQPPPEWFSGHRSGGLPTTEPHMALFPLSFVGSQYADGRVMGLGLAMPQNLNATEAGHCLESFLRESDTGLPRQHRLFDGRWFECTIELETREQPPHNLNPGTWTKSSRIWASVTPVVLNRHYKGKDKWTQAAENIKDACQHIGLPRPQEVLLHPTSLVQGVPTAREYPQLVRKSDGGRMSHNHALIIFDQPVRGPVLVGAGRFRGYGLCRPMGEQGAQNG